MSVNASGSADARRSVLSVRFSGAVRRLARVGGQDPELVADRLWGLGATSVEVGAEEGGTLLAGFDDVVRAQAAADALRAEAGASLVVEVDVVDRPQEVFGDGGHPSTTLALAALDAALGSGGRDVARSVLDVGTGTGVLAAAALRTGADRVVAVDVDELAVTVARANLDPARVEVVHGDVTAVAGAFGVVVANLGGVLAPLAVAAELAARVAPGGVLIVSGMLDPHVAPGALDPSMLDAALEELGLVLEQQDALDGWLTRTWRRY